jgi:hypothetical protein
MAASRYRTHVLSEISWADCSFSVRLVKRKEKTTSGNADNGHDDISAEVSPFTLSAAFSSFEPNNVHYKVEPAKRWYEMTSYNSFDCMKPPVPLR